MTDLVIDHTLTFTFPPEIRAEIFDKWEYINNYQRHRAGRKAVDIAAIEGGLPSRTLWLIEVKDFRTITKPPQPANLAGLPMTAAQKVQDSLAAMADAAHMAANGRERQFAFRAVQTPETRVVLHLEPHRGPRTALFPRGFSANVLQGLRLALRHIDPNPLVLSITTTPASGVPWQVS